MKTLALYGTKGKGKYIILDDEDYAKISKFKWYYTGRYARRSAKASEKHPTKIIICQRQILNFPDQMIDHINGNGLDNRKENLRLLDNTRNQWNQSISTVNTSTYKGVTFSKKVGKWQAQVRIYPKRYWLGYFDTAEEAGQAYEKFVEQNRGGFNEAVKSNLEVTTPQTGGTLLPKFQNGARGVSFWKGTGRWVVRSRVGKRDKFYGSFLTQEEAIAYSLKHLPQ